MYGFASPGQGLLPGSPVQSLPAYLNQLPPATDWDQFQAQQAAAINAPVATPWQRPAQMSTGLTAALGGVGLIASLLTRHNALAPLAQMVEGQNQQQDDYDYKVAAWQHEMDTTRQHQMVNLAADIGTLRNREQNDRLKAAIDLMQTDQTVNLRQQLADQANTFRAQMGEEKYQHQVDLANLRGQQQADLAELRAGFSRDLLIAGINARKEVQGMSPEERAAMEFKVKTRRDLLKSATDAKVRRGKPTVEKNTALGMTLPFQKGTPVAPGKGLQYSPEEITQMYGSVDANVAAYSDSLLSAAVAQTPHQNAAPQQTGPSDADLRANFKVDPAAKGLNFAQYKERYLKAYSRGQ